MDLKQSIVIDNSKLQDRLDNKEEVVDFVYKAFHIWSARHPERADDVVSPQLKEHTWGVSGLEEIKEICIAMHKAFEEYQLKVCDVIHEGSLEKGKISCRFEASGVFAHDYCGVTATGQRIHFPGTLIWHISSRKITDAWVYQSYSECPELGHAIMKLSHEKGAHF